MPASIDDASDPSSYYDMDDKRRLENERSRGQIDDNFAIFDGFVSRARTFLDRGRFDAAATYAQMAADHAWHNHPGLFVSPRLEKILCAIGYRVTPAFSRPKPRAPTGAMPDHVFHILTRAQGIGGHTRMVWRWISQDTERTHSVVITRQHAENVPLPLQDAVRASGGHLQLIDRRIGGLVSRAKVLRRAVAPADLVVLHTHPYDVVPTIAFAQKPSLPPIAFLNHADHVFWLGASISDVIANVRQSGLILAQSRRYLPPDRCTILPVPLNPSPISLSKREAKTHLDLPDDSIVLLSVAAPYKFASEGAIFNGVGFLEALIPIIESHQNVMLFVIGPENNGDWLKANCRTHGRIKALGIRQDIATFYRAADIYIDSFPFGSLTSLLEAGIHGLPLLSYSPHPWTARILGVDDPALENSLMRMSEIDDFQSVLTRLIADVDFRLHLGMDTSRSVLSVHSGQGWKQILHDLYARTSVTQPMLSTDSEFDLKIIDEVDLLLEQAHNASRVCCNPDDIIRGHIRLLPFDQRLTVWLKMRANNENFRTSYLVPEWAALYLKTRLMAR